MDVISVLKDNRINAINTLIEISVDEYLEYAYKILANNPYQRGRVNSSSTVYSLLREDLKQGCIIPPIVLALQGTQQMLSLLLDRQHLKETLIQNFDGALIIDGLQRTYNIIETYEDLSRNYLSPEFETFKNSVIRCEVYFGINKMGILYRMLTLNTGQTPMSLRHQIEMLYSDYLNQNFQGVTLITESDGMVNDWGYFKFRDAIDGFTSYLMIDYLPLDRFDILENIRSLEKLSTVSSDQDLFRDFVLLIHDLVEAMYRLSEGWYYNEENSSIQLSSSPFGRDAYLMFKKSQVFTALGAAIGFLKDKKLSDIDRAKRDLRNIKLKSKPSEAFELFLYRIDEIRGTAAKIGNAQREIFYYFFRELFNPEGDSYLVFESAIDGASKRYKQNA